MGDIEKCRIVNGSRVQLGKHFLSDKPAFTTLEALGEARRVQRETGKIYAIDYGERLRNAAMVR